MRDGLPPKTDPGALLKDEQSRRRAAERALARLLQKQRLMLERRDVMQGRLDAAELALARLQQKHRLMLERRDAMRSRHKAVVEGHRRAVRDNPSSRSLRTRLRVLSALPIAPSDALEARQREDDFKRTSEAYAKAATESWPPPDVQPVEIDGLTFWVPLDDRLPERAARAAAQDLAYRAILQARELTVGGLMIDIGANLGRTSVPRIILGDVDAVYGFEADPDNFRCLVHTTLSNGLEGRLLPDHAAVAAEDGTVSLRKSRFVGGHRLVRGSAERQDIVRVPARRLDSLIASHEIDTDAIRYVKVDVQGWEVGVLRGAAELLQRRHIVWQLEIDLHLLKAAGFSPAELLGPIQASFTNFVDVNPEAPGKRHRATTELPEALAYLPSDGSMKTDILVYNV